MTICTLLIAPLLLGQATLEEPTLAPPQPIPARIEPAPATPVETDDVPRFIAPSVHNAGPTDDAAEDAVADKTLAPTVSAAQFLEEALSEQARAALTGSPMRLVDALAHLSDRQQQLAAVRAYWNLSISVARYHFARDEFARVTSIVSVRPPQRPAALRAAEEAARARMSRARLSAVAAQYDLAETALTPLGGGPPLPVDRPFVGTYRTNFQELFAGRVAPRGTRRIDAALPLEHELIGTRAGALGAAQQAASEAFDAYGRGEADLTAVLRSVTHLQSQRLALLEEIRDYNDDIAEFALTVAGPGMSRQAIVAMLIETAPRTSSVLVPSRLVQPATALEPVPAEAHLPPVEEPKTNDSPFRDVTPGRIDPLDE